MLLFQRRVFVIVAIMSFASGLQTNARAVASKLLAFTSSYRRSSQRRHDTSRIALRRDLATTTVEASNQTQQVGHPVLHLDIPTAQDMEDFGALLSALILNEEEEKSQQGSVIFLDGDLGAGKTALARGFVRASTGQQRVTSPTYLLSNTYQVPNKDNLEIHHIDLYRLSGTPKELLPLNLDYVFRDCISLIEWPSRLGDRIPSERLEVYITIPSDYDPSQYDEEDKLRHMTLRPFGGMWQDRLQTLLDEGYVDDLLTEEE